MCSCDISHNVYKARTLSAEIAPRDVICNMNVHCSVVMTTFAGYDPHLTLIPATGGGVNYPPALFSLNLLYFQISHRDDFL